MNEPKGPRAAPELSAFDRAFLAPKPPETAAEINATLPRYIEMFGLHLAHLNKCGLATREQVVGVLHAHDGLAGRLRALLEAMDRESAVRPELQLVDATAPEGQSL